MSNNNELFLQMGRVAIEISKLQEMYAEADAMEQAVLAGVVGVLVKAQELSFVGARAMFHMLEDKEQGKSSIESVSSHITDVMGRSIMGAFCLQKILFLPEGQVDAFMSDSAVTSVMEMEDAVEKLTIGFVK